MRKLALFAGTASVALAQPAFAVDNVINGPAISAPGVPLGDWLRGRLRAGIILAATAFTQVGASVYTNRITQSGTAPKYIGWGTNGTAATTADTALGTESAPTTGGGRTVGSESRTTGTYTNDQHTITGTVTSGTTQTIQEAGTFDAVSAGNMAIRGNFTGIGVNNGDSIAFTFNLKLVPSAA